MHDEEKDLYDEPLLGEEEELDDETDEEESEEESW